MSRKKYQHYNEEFRREAVLRSEKPGVTQAMVAKELGVSAQQIANWKRQFKRLSDKQFNSLNGVDYSKKESEVVRKLRRELNEVKKENEFLNKACCVLCESPKVKYALIREHVGQCTVTLMCRVLGVSRGGYYDWRKRRKCKRQMRNELLTEQVAETYAEFKGLYGAIRIKQELNAAGIACSVNYVAKLLQIQRLKARNGKGFKYDKHANAMTNVADNVLKQNFRAKRSNKKWTTDITYIWVENQWFYLAVVMDLYSKRIVGWSLDNSMTEKIVINAIEMAFKRREIKLGLIVHSD